MWIKLQSMHNNQFLLTVQMPSSCKLHFMLLHCKAALCRYVSVQTMGLLLT